MKVPSLIFVAFAACLFSPRLVANDWKTKDPAQLAEMARRSSQNLREQALHMETEALQSGKALSADAKKFIELTKKEAEWLEKSADAWENNQKRLADNYYEKAMEFCEKRGPLAEKLWAKKEPSVGKPGSKVPVDQNPWDPLKKPKIPEQAPVKNEAAEKAWKKSEPSSVDPVAP